MTHLLARLHRCRWKRWKQRESISSPSKPETITAASYSVSTRCRVWMHPSSCISAQLIDHRLFILPVMTTCGHSDKFASTWQKWTNTVQQCCLRLPPAPASFVPRMFQMLLEVDSGLPLIDPIEYYSCDGATTPMTLLHTHKVQFTGLIPPFTGASGMIRLVVNPRQRNSG